MASEVLAFYAFAAVAVVASLLVIAQRNPIYSVLLLIASFGALSGLYVLLEAPFVAVEMKAEGSGRDARLAFRLNIGELVVAGPDHPLRFVAGEDGPRPYLLVRDGLEARGHLLTSETDTEALAHLIEEAYTDLVSLGAEPPARTSRPATTSPARKSPAKKPTARKSTAKKPGPRKAAARPR